MPSAPANPPGDREPVTIEVTDECRLTPGAAEALLRLFLRHDERMRQNQGVHPADDEAA